MYSEWGQVQESDMRLLHGSNIEIRQPDLRMCKSNNDFGRGFYLTPQWQRAFLMAKRRAGRDGGNPVVNAFLFNEIKALKAGLKIKRFKGFSSEWARFVIYNRTDRNFSHDYDIVIGPVADTFVDKEIERHRLKYGTGYLETEALLDFAEHVSQFGDDYEQYCFTTGESISKLIRE